MNSAEATPARFPEEADVVICGGGPAGSTAAILLARAGRRVVVIERERFPRFHIGESLLPWNLPIFERLGVLSKLVAAGTQVKYGARFYHQDSDRTRFVKFANGIDSDHPTAFQVKRADFDLMLLSHARDCGAQVFEGTRALGATFDAAGRATGLRVRPEAGGEEATIRAKVVLDATGRDALLSRDAGRGRSRDPRLERSATFAHWNGFHRAPGPEGGDIIVVTTPDGWWWMIPFSDGSVSVGIVMPSKRFAERKGSLEEFYAEKIAGCRQVRELLEGFERTTEVHAIADYSYKTAKITGDGWAALGDAACFLDPVFSTGVLMAMTSAEMAADTIDAALARQGRVDEADWQDLETVYRRGVSTFTRFVHGFYEPHFLETFYTQSPNKWIERGVTTVLGGGTFRPTLAARFWVWVFHACTWGAWIAQRVRGKREFERGTGIIEAA